MVKIYIDIILFVVILLVYVNNKSFASELVSTNNVKHESVSSNDTKRKPVLATDSKRKPVSSNDAKRKPVLANNAKHEPVLANDAKRKPVSTNNVKHESVSSNDAKRKSVLVNNVKHEPVSVNDIKRKPVPIDDDVYKLPSTSGFIRKPTPAKGVICKVIPTNEVIRKPVSSNDAKRKPVSINDVIRKPIPANDGLRRLAMRNATVLKLLSSGFSLPNFNSSLSTSSKSTSSISSPPKTTNFTLANSSLNENCEQNDSLTCTDPEETQKATELMNEAVTALQKIAKNVDVCDHVNKQFDIDLYCKKHEEDTEIAIFSFEIKKSNNYNEIINKVWSPNGIKSFDEYHIKEKIVRVYNPNLVMMQQRRNSIVGPFKKYSYVLATKVEVSSDTTIIVFSSANINDYNSASRNTYTNTILKSANEFKTNVNSEEDIKDGKLKKFYINLYGYIIKKEERRIDVTYVYSINTMAYDVSYAPSFITKMEKSEKLLMLSSLKEFFDRK
ncbi:fam-a protein [Plasmodium berghei]|uniref:Fam-a protein n=1 Tax=Plasmodium berghei TaxID=5821 RepID=A0A1D3Q177_PLABE|nr:fam-a protein [Plasmodium berghei]SCO62812.1 fam-a protein [Plasmodium berghei]